MNRNKKTREILMCDLAVIGILLVTSMDAKADFTFDKPTNLGPPINQGPHFSSFEGDYYACLSTDGLTLYFGSERPGGSGSCDIWVAARESTTDIWGEPANLGSHINRPAWDGNPRISTDGLSLYFDSFRGGGRGNADIWVTTRITVDSVWRTPQNIGALNTSQADRDPSISSDGLTLYFSSKRSGNWDLYQATRPNQTALWSGTDLESIQIVNSPQADRNPFISADGLSLFFSSTRAEGFGNWDLYVATRLTVDSPWSDPVNLGDTINTVGGADYAPSISSDSLTLYYNLYGMIFMSTRPSLNEPFGTPAHLSTDDFGVALSRDGLAMYFATDRPGSYGYADIYVSYRDSLDSPWQEPINVGPGVNGKSYEWAPSLSLDGLELYFSSGRASDMQGSNLWVSTRDSIEGLWSPAVSLGDTVNSNEADYHPAISGDGLILIFGSERPGGIGGPDLWMTERIAIDEPWQTPTHLGGAINTQQNEYWPSISADGRWLFFVSHNPDASIWNNIMVSARTADGKWDIPRNLALDLNLPHNVFNLTVSPDGRTVFFGSNNQDGMGGDDIWKMDIIPILDFNDDGYVDDADVCILMDHWLTDYPLCDIGPTPIGDGIVNAQDLLVLANYIAENIDDPHFIAHWKLDETEGNLAYDSIMLHDATVNGDALWQPEGGQVDGALQFDGIDDYIATPVTINPIAGPFSVFAWIKGGEPGQVILSQAGSFYDWLSTNQAGNLMTSLTFPRPPLTSEFVITDNTWHTIGLVSDGSSLCLYADDVEVARNNLAPVLPAMGNLLVGAGKNLEAGTFWSGLIDDVRVYDRVAKP
jgi:Tol biopolymer transport system component